MDQCFDYKSCIFLTSRTGFEGARIFLELRLTMFFGVVFDVVFDVVWLEYLDFVTEEVFILGGFDTLVL